MSAFGKSSISFIIFMMVISPYLFVIAQQKANDFTKRVGAFDGKMNAMTGRTSTLNRFSPSSARRFKVEDWPSHFSPFGGKRFPMGSARIIGSERVPTSKIEVRTPLKDRIARESHDRATNGNLGKSAPASNSVEYKDAYHASLDDRVNQWMEKVNNMSLRDINRYQFRKDRPSKPGFPVQRAGAKSTDLTKGETPLIESGLTKQGKMLMPKGNENYWIGPKTTKSSANSLSLDSRDQSYPDYSQANSKKEERKFVTGPKPILGPKTIRVEVGKTE